MSLWVIARARFVEKEDPDDNVSPLAVPESDDANYRSRMSQESLSHAIPMAHAAAQLLCDFRERYGLKVSPAWLLQLQAVAAGVLLLDPELAEPAIIPAAKSARPAGTIQDSRTAFDEVFRCLLGTGVEVMIARGISRMMYHTALEQKIALSRSTRTMLQIMSDTAWRPSDLSLVNSVFPNFATIRGQQGRERLTELLEKWEKLDI